MDNLILVRHGQTKLNAKRRLQGWYDAPLTEQGHKTTNVLQETLANIPITAAFTSDFQRAVTTTELILAQRDPIVPVTKLPLLREYYFGGLEGHSDLTTIRRMIQRFGITRVRGMIKTGTGFPNLIQGFANLDQTKQAESFDQLENRGHQILDYFKEDSLPGNTLVVAHSLVLSTLIYILAPEQLPATLLKNSQVSILQRTPTGFSVTGVNLADTNIIQASLQH